MNRLQLAQKVHRILRIDANLPGTAPTATTGQTGVLAEIVAFVDDSYRRIQSDKEWWGFRLTQGTFPTVAGTRAYTRATIQGSLSTFDQLLPASGQGFRALPVYLASTGVSDSSLCTHIPYAQWRTLFDFGTRSSGKPSRFTVRQDQTIEFDPTPDAVYTVAIDYRRTLHALTADATEPLFADDFHDAIVWGAVMSYAETRDGALYQVAERNFRREMGKLRGRYLPEMTWDGTLFWGKSP